MSVKAMKFQMGEDGLPVPARIEMVGTERPFTNALILIPADVDKLKQELQDKIQGMRLMGMEVPEEINDELIDKFFEDMVDGADQGTPMQFCNN